MFGLLTSSRRVNPTSGKPISRVGGSFVELETRDTPAVIATADFYDVQRGSVLSINALEGVLKNDFSTTNPLAILSSSIVTKAAYAPALPGTNAPALPATALELRVNGSFTFIAPSDYQAAFGDVVFTYQVIDQRVPSDVATATVRIRITDPQVSGKLYATGSGPGVTNEVRVYEAASGNPYFTVTPYESSYTGGVRVATGDLNNDGFDDIVTSTADGGAARIRIYDGLTRVPVSDFFAFEESFRGGAEIAIGKVEGFGVNKGVGNKLIVGAGTNGGPRVTVFNVNPSPVVTKALVATPLYDFFAYEQSQRNGARVASGNVYGITGADARDFIVTGAAPGGGPSVKIFDGRDLAQQIPLTDTPSAKGAFFAFDQNNRSGVSVAVGKLRGVSDPSAATSDIVVASGDVVRVFSAGSGALLREFALPQTDGSITGSSGFGSGNSTNPSTGSSNFGNTGGGLVTVGGGVNPNGTGGVRVAVTDRNSDGISDIIVGASSGQLPRVRIFSGTSFAELDNFLAYSSSFIGGVFVGGNSL
jgi:hypothetical protein